MIFLCICNQNGCVKLHISFKQTEDEPQKFCYSAFCQAPRKTKAKQKKKDGNTTIMIINSEFLYKATLTKAI